MIYGDRADETLKLELIKDLIKKISDSKLTYNQLVTALATELVEYELNLKPLPLGEQINKDNIIYTTMAKIEASKRGKENAKKRSLNLKDLYEEMKENLWSDLKKGIKNSNNHFAKDLMKRFPNQIKSQEALSRKVSAWRKEYESNNM